MFEERAHQAISLNGLVGGLALAEDKSGDAVYLGEQQ